MTITESIDQIVAGLSQSKGLLRTRRYSSTKLLETLNEDGLHDVDIFLVELWLGRIEDDLNALKKNKPRAKLTRDNRLARQCCTAVLFCRDLLAQEGFQNEATLLMESYQGFSHLEVSPDEKLKMKKVVGWLNFEYHENWPTSASVKS